MKTTNSERVTTALEKLPSFVTARDIMQPLYPYCDAKGGVNEVTTDLMDKSLEEGWDPYQIYVAAIDGVPIGYFDIDLSDVDDPASKSIKDICSPIEIGSVVAANTRALDVLRLFATQKYHFYLVLDENRIIGTIQYPDLFRPAFLLVILGMTLQLEEVALSVICLKPKASWECLSSGRQEKAREILIRRRGPFPQEKPPPYKSLLGCTGFCEKRTIIVRRKLIVDASELSLLGIFDMAETLRNECAHTSPEPKDSVEIMDPVTLCDTIRKIQALIARLAEVHSLAKSQEVAFEDSQFEDKTR